MLIEIQPEIQQMLINIISQTAIALPPAIQNRSEMNLTEMQQFGQITEVQKLQQIVFQLQNPVPAPIEEKLKKLIEAEKQATPPITSADVKKEV